MFFKRFFKRKADKESLYQASSQRSEKGKRKPKSIFFDLKSQNEKLENLKRTMETQLEEGRKRRKELEDQESNWRSLLEKEKGSKMVLMEKNRELQRQNERLEDENKELKRKLIEAQMKQKESSYRSSLLNDLAVPPKMTKKQCFFPEKRKNTLKRNEESTRGNEETSKKNYSLRSSNNGLKLIRNSRTSRPKERSQKNSLELSIQGSLEEFIDQPHAAPIELQNGILLDDLVSTPKSKATSRNKGASVLNSNFKTLASSIQSSFKLQESTKTPEHKEPNLFFARSRTYATNKNQPMPVQMVERTKEYQPMKPHLPFPEVGGFKLQSFNKMNQLSPIPISKRFCPQMITPQKERPSPLILRTSEDLPERSLKHFQRKPSSCSHLLSQMKEDPNSQDCLPPFGDYPRFRLSKRIDTLVKDKESLLRDNQVLQAEIKEKNRSLSRETQRVKNSSSIIERQKWDLRRASEERSELAQELRKKSNELVFLTQELQSKPKVCEICLMRTVNVAFESCPHLLCEKCYFEVSIEKKPCPFCKRKMVEPHKI